MQASADSGISFAEVIVAMAIMAVALLGLGRALGTAVRFAATAERVDAAVELAAGVDADGEPPAAPPGCRVRTTSVGDGDSRWLHVQVRCGADREPGATRVQGGIDMLVFR